MLKRTLLLLIAAACFAAPLPAQQLSLHSHLGISDRYLVLPDPNLPVVKVHDRRTGELVETVKTRQPVKVLNVDRARNKAVAGSGQYLFYIDLEDFSIGNELKLHEGGTYNTGNETVPVEMPLADFVVPAVAYPNGVVAYNDMRITYEWAKAKVERESREPEVMTTADTMFAIAMQVMDDEKREKLMEIARKTKELEEAQKPVVEEEPAPSTTRYYDVVAAEYTEDPGAEAYAAGMAALGQTAHEIEFVRTTPVAEAPPAPEYPEYPSEAGMSKREYARALEAYEAAVVEYEEVLMPEWTKALAAVSAPPLHALRVAHGETGATILEVQDVREGLYIGDETYLALTEFTLDAYDLESGELLYSLDLY